MPPLPLLPSFSYLPTPYSSVQSLLNTSKFLPSQKFLVLLIFIQISIHPIFFITHDPYFPMSSSFFLKFSREHYSAGPALFHMSYGLTGCIPFGVKMLKPVSFLSFTIIKPAQLRLLFGLPQSISLTYQLIRSIGECKSFFWSTSFQRRGVRA